MNPDVITATTTAWFGTVLGRVVAALLVLLVAWIVAAILRWLTRKLLTAVHFDQRMRTEGASATVAQAIYWLTFLVFLPAILGALGVQAILDPLTAMINSLLAYIPMIIAAVVILLIGVFIARIARQLTVGVLSGLGADRLGARFGFGQLSTLIGTIVYILILLPTLIAALQALQLTSVTVPLTAMLNDMLNAVPLIIAASVMIALAYYIGRVVADLATNLLTGLGFNNIFVWLGIQRTAPDSGQTPARIVGGLIWVFIVYTAVMQAAYVLRWTALGDLLSQFLVLAIQIILGVIIIAVGLWLGNAIARLVRASSLPQGNLLAFLAQIGTFLLFAAMGLTQMGLGQQIVVLAFGLTLGGAALAAALAFGLGGREAAARVLSDARASLESRGEAIVPPPAEPPAIEPPAPGQ